jgi:hypothetical protein
MESITTYPRRSDGLIGGGGTREYPSKEENQESAEAIVQKKPLRDGEGKGRISDEG